MEPRYNKASRARAELCMQPAARRHTAMRYLEEALLVEMVQLKEHDLAMEDLQASMSALEVGRAVRPGPRLLGQLGKRTSRGSGELRLQQQHAAA